jgi:hypothetical protein
MASAETGVTTTTTTAVASGMLRPERHGQEERERRNERQATNTKLL